MGMKLTSTDAADAAIKLHLAEVAEIAEEKAWKPNP